jgi:hypothetical protein
LSSRGYDMDNRNGSAGDVGGWIVSWKLGWDALGSAVAWVCMGNRKQQVVEEHVGESERDPDPRDVTRATRTCSEEVGLDDGRLVVD